MLLNRAIPFLRKKMPVRGTDRARSRSRSRSLERTDQTHTKEGAPIDKPVGDSETPARVLNCLTIAEKDALCKFKATSPSTGNTALKAYAKAQFGKEPSSSQISRILQEPHKWAVQEGRVNARKVRNGKWPTLEAALNVAFSQERQTGQNIPASAILKKAKELAPELGIKDFTGSNTWAENFRTRSRFSSFHVPAPSELAAPSTSLPASVLPAELGFAAHAQDGHRTAVATPPREFIVNALGVVGPFVELTLEGAHQAACYLSSYMEQNSDEFTVPEQLQFERGIKDKLNKLVIAKMTRAANLQFKDD